MILCSDTDRSDLYLTIERGEFERGSKTAQKNVEVRVLVLRKDGKLIEVEYKLFVTSINGSSCYNDHKKVT